MTLSGVSEDDAYREFLKLRWPDTDGAPVCPRCGGAAVYQYKARKIFKCKGCFKQFSVTTGTIFDKRKAPFAMLLSLLGRRDLNALRISEELGLQYKAAYVLCKKLREAYAKGQPILQQPISNVAGYFQRKHL